MKGGRKILVFPFIQGCYYLITLIWPLVHIKSFMAVTGYKRDVWLVDQTIQV